MMSYRDMTFCPYWKECIDGTECPRALTDEVANEATDINLYISIFSQSPECMNRKGVTNCLQETI